MDAAYSRFSMLLEEKNLKPVDITRETGVSSTVLSEWKSGKSTPKTDKLIAIARALGTSVEYLMTGTDASVTEDALVEKMKRDPIFWNNAKMLFFMRPADQEYIYRSIELVAENADKKKETASA